MVGHLVEDLVDHEHQMVWAVELEVAALLENWIVLHYYPTFPALVVTVVLAGVHRSAVTMNFALYFVLASQLRVVPARRRFAERTRVHTDWTYHLSTVLDMDDISSLPRSRIAQVGPPYLWSV